MLALDLGVFHRKSHVVGIKEAGGWSIVWITLAMIFNLGILMFMDDQTMPDGKVVTSHALAGQFLAAYLLEKSLSVDNLFVFLVLFSYFKVDPAYQHRVLFWGIIGALIMRAIMIVAGMALINQYHFLIPVLGLFLIVTGIKMVLAKDKEMNPEANPVLLLLRKFLPIAKDFNGDRFTVRQNGKLLFTPLLVVLVLIETTDLVFAIDSIPAVMGISKDPFIVYTSNVFAILGLRALFFVLSGIMSIFHHLVYGLSFILCFIGTKMVLELKTITYPVLASAGGDWLKFQQMEFPLHLDVPIAASLSVVLGTLTLTVVTSLLFPKKSGGGTGH